MRPVMAAMERPKVMIVAEHQRVDVVHRAGAHHTTSATARLNSSPRAFPAGHAGLDRVR